MNNNQENITNQELSELIKTNDNNFINLINQNIKYFKNQILNSQEHLRRIRKILGETSLTKSQIQEVVYIFKKEAEYLGACKNELQNCYKLLTKYQEPSGIANLKEFYQDQQTKKHGV